MFRIRIAAAAAVIAACAPAHTGPARSGNAPAPARGKRELTESEQIAHVLSRLTFGPRPGDAERLKAVGVDRWIAEQLTPDAIPDSSLSTLLGAMKVWTTPTAELSLSSFTITSIVNRPVVPVVRPESVRVLVGDTLKRVAGDTVKRVTLTPAPVTFSVSGSGIMSLGNQFYAGQIAHAQLGERQLLEVITNFWENHFSIYSAKTGGQEALVAWERDVIRPHALGKFRDLLAATAMSPAMMFYLDNHLSRKNALNENYARELMELHTLGVDGGYTQQDVINVAKAFTGWSRQITPVGPPTVGAVQRTVAPSFSFNPANHDSSEKVVLGHTLAEGRGVADGKQVLEILATHPSTAKYISYKLARRLVSDDPPPALVARAAATFRDTDGDIAEVVRTIVTSPEFFSRAAFRAKTKTPFEFVVSARRALEAPVDTTTATNALLTTLGQPMFGRLTPDGWPDNTAAWMNSGSVMKRILSGVDFAGGRQRGFSVDRWSGWNELAALQTPAQADGVLKMMFGGYVDPALKAALVNNQYTAPATDGRARLTEMVAMVIGSPDFQRR